MTVTVKTAEIELKLLHSTPHRCIACRHVCQIMLRLLKINVRLLFVDRLLVSFAIKVNLKLIEAIIIFRLLGAFLSPKREVFNWLRGE